MNKGARKRGWVAYACTGLIMIIIVACLLGICRSQLHQQAIESEYHSLKTSFDKIYKDQTLVSFSNDLNSSSGRIYADSFLFNTRKTIEQCALQSLKIPQVFGVQAYDAYGNPADLVTSLDSSTLKPEMVSKILLQGWSHRTLDQRTWGLTLRPEELESEYLIEFQLLLDPLRESWERIDRTLLVQGTILCIAALLVLAIVYWILISKLSGKEIMLEEKSRVLAETNRKLSNAFKSAGLGAMTGHLMHGLKSPLTSLQSISNDIRTQSNERADSELLQSLERIQILVKRVLQSLGEMEEGEVSYFIDLRDFCELACKRFSSDHPSASIVTPEEFRQGIFLDNLQCHLSLAILSNLFQNSIDAKKDTRIELNFHTDGQFLQILVSDDAGGIPDNLSGVLFSPIVSSKPGGTGIGLALSKQLAESMEGTLELISNNRSGSSFSLKLPMLETQSK